MSKKDYRVRNWKEYNKALIGRGSITLWLDEASLGKWYEEKGGKRKRGRPKKYSDFTVALLLTVKHVYRLTFRACQGFVESLLPLLDLKQAVPYYTQLCRRQAGLKCPPLGKDVGNIHMVVDASGLKVFGEGEWKVRQHGWTKRRTWRKLHIGVDEKRGLIVSADLTESQVSEDKLLEKLLNHYEGKIDQVSADGAYDSHDSHEVITQRGALGTIPPQQNPRHHPKTFKQLKKPRDYIVWEIQQIGRSQWKQQSGYHRRSLVENMFYRYKRLLGDKLTSHKLENQKVEALLKCQALNKMTLLGLPISEAIN